MGRVSKTQYVVLGVLNQKEASGYEVRKKIIEEYSHFWHESFGGIYPTIDKLEKKGLIYKVRVETENPPFKKIYAVTDEGHKYLNDWLKSDIEIGKKKDEVLLKLMFSTDLSSKEKQILLLQIEKKFRLRLKNLHELQDSQTEGRKDDKQEMWLLTLLYEMYSVESALRWLDKVKKSLEK